MPSAKLLRKLQKSSTKKFRQHRNSLIWVKAWKAWISPLLLILTFCAKLFAINFSYLNSAWKSAYLIPISNFLKNVLEGLLFLGDLQYFIVTPHWMCKLCTNIWRPLHFSSSLFLSKGTPRVLRPGIKPRTYQMAGRRANQWARPHPIELQFCCRVLFVVHWNFEAKLGSYGSKYCMKISFF